MASSGSALPATISTSSDANVSLEDGTFDIGVDVNAVGVTAATAIGGIGAGFVRVAYADEVAGVELINSSEFAIDALAVATAVDGFSIAGGGFLIGVAQAAIGSTAATVTMFNGTGDFSVAADVVANAGVEATAVAIGGVGVAQFALADGRDGRARQ